MDVPGDAASDAASEPPSEPASDLVSPARRRRRLFGSGVAAAAVVAGRRAVGASRRLRAPSFRLQPRWHGERQVLAPERHRDIARNVLRACARGSPRRGRRSRAGSRRPCATLASKRGTCSARALVGYRRRVQRLRTQHVGSGTGTASARSLPSLGKSLMRAAGDHDDAQRHGRRARRAGSGGHRAAGAHARGAQARRQGAADGVAEPSARRRCEAPRLHPLYNRAYKTRDGDVYRTARRRARRCRRATTSSSRAGDRARQRHCGGRTRRHAVAGKFNRALYDKCSAPSVVGRARAPVPPGQGRRLRLCADAVRRRRVRLRAPARFRGGRHVTTPLSRDHIYAYLAGVPVVGFTGSAAAWQCEEGEQGEVVEAAAAAPTDASDDDEGDVRGRRQRAAGAGHAHQPHARQRARRWCRRQVLPVPVRCKVARHPGRHGGVRRHRRQRPHHRVVAARRARHPLSTSSRDAGPGLLPRGEEERRARAEAARSHCPRVRRGRRVRAAGRPQAAGAERAVQAHEQAAAHRARRVGQPAERAGARGVPDRRPGRARRRQHSRHGARRAVCQVRAELCAVHDGEGRQRRGRS